MIKASKISDFKKLSVFDSHNGERRTDIKAFDRTIVYRGYEIKRNSYIPNGGDGRWEVPTLHHVAIGGVIEGFLTVSITQGKEAIDEWFMLNLELKG